MKNLRLPSNRMMSQHNISCLKPTDIHISSTFLRPSTPNSRKAQNMPEKWGGVLNRLNRTALNTNYLSKGFTLIELLVVIGILSVMATIALDNVTGDVNEQRFDQTVYKMKNIRRAILGSDKVVNGAPVLEGFVADMGRLPNNMAELLNPKYCQNYQYKNKADCEDTTKGNSIWVQLQPYDDEHCNDPQYTTPTTCAAALDYCSDTSYTTESTCTGASETWFDIKWIGGQHCSDPIHTTKTACGAAGDTWFNQPKILSGWRGPYINVFADLGGQRTYRDGWANKIAASDVNSGWVFNVSDINADSLNDDLELRSKGLNNVNDAFANTLVNVYDADVPDSTLSTFEKPYPPHYDGNKALLIAQHDFQVVIPAAVTVDFSSAPQCWKCSVGGDNNYNDCAVTNGNDWIPIVPQPIDSTACGAASGHWQPSDKLCLRVYKRKDGIFETLESGAPSSAHAWNTGNASFSIAGNLTVGNHGYGVYYYDDVSTISNCTDNLVFRDKPDGVFSITPRGNFPASLEWRQN